MKRWILLVMILLLILSGCNTDGPNNTEGTLPGTTTQPPTQPPVSVYIQGGALEKNTDGAVKTYAIDGGEIIGIDNLGEDIVVFAYDGEKTTMTRISGREGMVKATAQRSGMILPADGSVGTAENKLAYFDGEQNSIVFLDGTFHEVDRIAMPEGATSAPVLSADLSGAFYCTGNEIRSLDLVTEIPRLVCQLNLQQVQIKGLLLNDGVLHCYVTDMDGNHYSAFYSAITGERLGIDSNLKTVASWDENYLVRRTDGPVEEILISGADGELRSFHIVDGILAPSAAIGGLIHVSGTAMAVYEPAHGNSLGSVMLNGAEAVSAPIGDGSGRYVWFAAKEPDTGKDILCCWEYTAGGSDDIVRTGVRYTAENPDTVGLAECEQLAADISGKYGVNILLGDKPVEPEDYSFVPEYQVFAYKKALTTLDNAMARFPEGFFETVATSSENPKLQINLVRAIVPNRYDVPASNDGLQYWIDLEAYMTLVVNDRIEQSFYNELCHAMGAYVGAHSNKYAHWSLCNPEDFQYDNSYTDYASHLNSPYLQGENRAFIDAYSMTFAHEDRAAVFTYAMTDGCADYFTSDAMQKKLALLCEDIRRAFGWRKYEGTFPWEQYLKESMAYVDKK